MWEGALLLCALVLSSTIVVRAVSSKWQCSAVHCYIGGPHGSAISLSLSLFPPLSVSPIFVFSLSLYLSISLPLSPSLSLSLSFSLFFFFFPPLPTSFSHLLVLCGSLPPNTETSLVTTNRHGDRSRDRRRDRSRGEREREGEGARDRERD